MIPQDLPLLIEIKVIYLANIFYFFQSTYLHVICYQMTWDSPWGNTFISRRYILFILRNNSDEMMNLYEEFL